MARPRNPDLAAGAIDQTDNTELAQAMVVVAVDAHALAAVQDEQQAAARRWAALIGYQGNLHPDVLTDLVLAGERRSAEGAWLSGTALLMLKEVTPHGEFIRRVEATGIDQRMARRRMTAVIKFSKTGNATRFVEATGNQSRFLELATLDDDELKCLADGGAVGDVQLDKLDAMTHRELRAALREAKQDEAATEKLMAEKSAEIDRLRRVARKHAVVDWPEAFAGYITQVQHAHRTIKVQIGALDIVRERAMAIEPSGADEEASLQKAREMLATELLHIHRRCAQYLDALGNTFDKTLGAFADEEI